MSNYTEKQIRGFKHKSLKQIVNEFHIGYNKRADYSLIVQNRSLSKNDIEFIRDTLKDVDSQVGYDSFVENGGIDICLYLFEELLKIKEDK